MAGDPRPEDLPGLLASALATVRGKRAQVPTSSMYESIEAQLEYMDRTVRAGDRPPIDKLKTINVGLLAVREIEASDPDFADALMRIQYLFEQLR